MVWRKRGTLKKVRTHPDSMGVGFSKMSHLLIVYKTQVTKARQKFNVYNSAYWNWVHNSVLEHLLRMYDILSSISSSNKKRHSIIS